MIGVLALVVPTIGASVGTTGERLALDLADQQHVETRTDTRLLSSVGVAHPLASFVDGHASLGFGPTTFTGRYQLVAREDVTAIVRFGRLALRVGLGPGVTWDVSRPTMSFAELGVPLSLTLFDQLELVYRPYLALPLAHERRDVFAGTSSRSADLAVVWFETTLRLRLPALGF